MMHTQESIYRECKKFKIGDRVTFERKNKETKKEENIEGKVVERYPYLLVIAYKSQNGSARTSFSYVDVVAGRVKKKLGRKKKEVNYE